MADEKMVNGVDVQTLGEKAKQIKANPELGAFRFHVHNDWLSCGHSRTTIRSFYGVGEEIEHDEAFVLDADEPHVLLGGDEGPNPVEHLLNALVTCLTGAMAYHAALRGIHIEKLSSDVEGELDVRGFMGLEESVRRGYQNIKVTFHVKADAPKEKLEQCARFSPVFDTVTNGTNVELKIEKA